MLYVSEELGFCVKVSFLVVKKLLKLLFKIKNKQINYLYYIHY